MKRLMLTIKLYRMANRYRAYAENGSDPTKRKIIVFVFDQSKAMYDIAAPWWFPKIRPLNSCDMAA